jgi:hypothetical protein
MTQTFGKPSSTCQSCPFFDDYQDERERGWCRGFDRPARLHHPKTPDCEQVSQPPFQTVRVELHTLAVEDDGYGYPVPVDSQVIEVTVNQLTREAVETALQPLLNLSEWVVTDFWQPEPESESEF